MQSHFRPNLHTWLSKEHWKERIVTFDNSWFTLTMGTGVIVQLLHFFPWPSYWLDNLSYVFWILDVVLFAFFVTMALLRLCMYPHVAISVLDDVSQTSFLGAIPITIDTIAVGIVFFYSNHLSARYVAEVFFWTSVALSVLVSCGGVFVMFHRQGRHELAEVTGVWLLAFIPMIVTPALGSTLSPYLIGNNEATVIIVSFLMLSLGLGASFMIVTIYLWRLLHCSLPPRDAIVSCFVPVGPFGMSAFAIIGLSSDLAKFISTQHFDLSISNSSPVDSSSQAAIAQMIEWLGVIIALSLLGIATFFLVEASASVLVRIPKTFNIGFWSFVFPCGVYSNAFCRLSTSIRNDAMKGWASVCVVATIALWLMCAVLTTYKGVWKGKLFVAPGLQGHVEQKSLDKIESDSNRSEPAISSNAHCQSKAISKGRVRLRRRAVVSGDGTYERISDENDP